jgi:hypothetical protein
MTSVYPDPDDFQKIAILAGLRSRMGTASTTVGSMCHKSSMFSIDGEVYSDEDSGYSSPRPNPIRSCTTPPDRTTEVRKHGNPLMRALQMNSVINLRRILEADPDAIDDFFFDLDFEPVLCAAVNLRCSAEVMTLLLEHGADAYAKDKHGRTARDLVYTRQNILRPDPPEQSLPPWMQACGQGRGSQSLGEDWSAFGMPPLFEPVDDAAHAPNMTGLPEVPLPIFPTLAAFANLPTPQRLPSQRDRMYEAWLDEVATLLAI